MRMATAGSLTTQRSTHKPHPTHFSAFTEGANTAWIDIPLEQTVVDGDGLVYKGACAIAHLAAISRKCDAQSLVDDGYAHAHVLSRFHVAQRVGGARCHAGEVLAEAAGVGSGIDAGRARRRSGEESGNMERSVRAGLDAFAALDAACKEIGVRLRTRRMQKTVCAHGGTESGFPAHDGGGYAGYDCSNAFMATPSFGNAS